MTCRTEYTYVIPRTEDGGPSKILCKFPNCTNPNCHFRHEDANGNPIPPPALTRKQAESSEMETDDPAEQDDVSVTMDHATSSAGMALGKSALDLPLGSTGPAKPLPAKPLNGTVPVPCKFGAGCTNPKCKFIHDNRKPCNFGVKCFKGSLCILVALPVFARLTHPLFQPTAPTRIHPVVNSVVQQLVRMASRHTSPRRDN